MYLFICSIYIQVSYWRLSWVLFWLYIKFCIVLVFVFLTVQSVHKQFPPGAINYIKKHGINFLMRCNSVNVLMTSIVNTVKCRLVDLYRSAAAEKSGFPRLLKGKKRNKKKNLSEMWSCRWRGLNVDQWPPVFIMKRMPETCRSGNNLLVFSRKRAIFSTKKNRMRLRLISCMAIFLRSAVSMFSLWNVECPHKCSNSIACVCIWVHVSVESERAVGRSSHSSVEGHRPPRELTSDTERA